MVLGVNLKRPWISLGLFGARRLQALLFFCPERFGASGLVAGDTSLAAHALPGTTWGVPVS